MELMNALKIHIFNHVIESKISKNLHLQLYASHFYPLVSNLANISLAQFIIWRLFDMTTHLTYITYFIEQAFEELYTMLELYMILELYTILSCIRFWSCIRCWSCIQFWSCIRFWRCLPFFLFKWYER